MSAVGPKSGVPWMKYLAPPRGLPDEWDYVYRVLAEPIRIAAGFVTGHILNVAGASSDPDPNRRRLKSFEAWLHALRNTAPRADEVLSCLYGRAPRTWNAGQAIDQAILSVRNALEFAVFALSYPVPEDQEGQAKAWQWRVAELRKLDWKPLLEELAGAVTGERGIHLGLRLSDPERPPSPPLATNASASRDEVDICILSVLNERSPLRLTVGQIAGASHVGEKTVRARLTLFIAEGLVSRPNGSRQGATITTVGIALLKKLSTLGLERS